MAGGNTLIILGQDALANVDPTNCPVAPLAVPNLTGFTPGDAKDALAGKGLEADVQEAGGLIELLLPEDARVCQQDPAAGTDVDPGSTVHVFAAKRC